MWTSKHEHKFFSNGQTYSRQAEQPQSLTTYYTKTKWQLVSLWQPPIDQLWQLSTTLAQLKDATTKSVARKFAYFIFPTD